MNINKNLTHIMSPESLKKHLLTYAKIDLIMNPAPDDFSLRVYHYDKNWVSSGDFLTINDSGGDHYYLLFSPSGCIIKGLDHECDISPYNFDEEEPLPDFIANHNFYEGAPSELQELLDDPALEKDIATFCVWQSTESTDWSFTPLQIPDDWSDGIETFLSYATNLQQYKKWFEEDYYESDLDMDTLQKIFDGEPITEEMILSLNPEVDTKIVLKELKENF